MREIKFRAWIGIGDECFNHGGKEAPFMIYGDDFMFEGYETVNAGMLENKFMQYIGLKDKAGIEIYEGDILQYGEVGNVLDRKIGVIEYFGDEGYPAFDIVPGIGSECNGLSLIMAEMECEVIGNVYENVGLLSKLRGLNERN